MKKSFWEERWQAGRTNFHRSQVSPSLLDHHERFLTAKSHRVLLPLCGKSLDIRWLADRGHEVVGVEFIEKAVQELGVESGFDFDVQDDGPFRIYRAGAVSIYQGDFFQLEAAGAGRFQRVYDRAALIALPQERRADYVRRIHEHLAEDGEILIETIYYDPVEMEGPPFAVPPQELESLFAWGFHMETLADEPNVDVPPHLQQKGLKRLHGRVSLMTRIGDRTG